MNDLKREAVVVRMNTRKYNDPDYWRLRAEEYRAQSSDYHDQETRRMMEQLARQHEQLATRIAEHEIENNFIAIRYSPDDIAKLILKDAMQRLGNRSLRLEGDQNGGFMVRTNNE